MGILALLGDNARLMNSTGIYMRHSLGGNALFFTNISRE